MILNCSTCDTPETLSVHCFPIPIEYDDPYFPPYHTDGTKVKKKQIKIKENFDNLALHSDGSIYFSSSFTRISQSTQSIDIFHRRFTRLN